MALCDYFGDKGLKGFYWLIKFTFLIWLQFKWSRDAANEIGDAEKVNNTKSINILFLFQRLRAAANIQSSTAKIVTSTTRVAERRQSNTKLQ